MSLYQFLSLATKPNAQLCYSFQPAVGTVNPALVVFVNGLGLPQTSWEGGQTTNRDPGNITAEDLMHGHDTLTVVRDLHQLLTQIASEKMGISEPSRLPLVLVSNSIGGALARLYARISRVLANSDFVSIYPDPDAPGFDPTSLPEGVTADDIRTARAYMQRVFHPSNGSREGLSRKNLAQLLPDSDGPKLQGPDGRGPWVTVVGHEFEAFKLTEVYMNPYWHRFNQGLTKLRDPYRSKAHSRPQGPVL
ncbi:hypothetical protein BDV30DRAFT_222168 [Aspergillus minisclerotigenes]|uniref:AB hydrolase-1 domain-containing protein n=1 Tax=Aspergillus minisclerotigenes TaxID=656917 RepID=A0A5N6JMM8_9EURO|nr:hypothetical protein BDV30DRAFT_222168 [Aspergillus minisclerotigenes]